MVTIKDIAKLAGVAQGTVSNVLNGRGNVSSEKILRVRQACETLGYIPNERAKTLRRGGGKTLGVLLTDTNSSGERDFLLSFQAYAEQHGYEARPYIPRSHGKAAEEAAIRMAQSDMVAGLAAFSTHVRSPEAYAMLRIPTLHVEQHIPGKDGYIGFDYAKAGRDMANRIRKDRRTQVVLIINTAHHTNEAAFAEAFESELEGKPCSVTTIHTDVQHLPMNLLQLMEQISDPVFVCSQIELAQAARNTLQTFCLQSTPILYTLSPIHILPEYSFIKYELNYRLLGNMAAQQLIRTLEKGTPLVNRTLSNTGFRSIELADAAVTHRKRALNVLTLDSPTAYSMRSMARLYSRQTGIPINVTIYSYDAIFEALTNLQSDSVFDVIRLDVTWLSWFAERILRPLEEIDRTVVQDLSTFLEGTPQHYAYVNDVLYALPGSPSTQLLFYRSDLFDEPIYRRTYQETYHTELKVPQSFDEFNRIAAFFTKRKNPGSSVEYGATLTLGSTGVAGSEYLARFFSMQPQLYDDNGRIILNGDIGIRALEQLLQIKECANPRFCSWWADTAAAFAQGSTAMAILYSNFAGPLVGRHSKVLDNIGFAPVPGGSLLIGGGSLGVSKYSKQPLEALNFIRWLNSEPIASASTLLGGVSPCRASSDNYEIINNYPWLKLVNRSFTADLGRRTPPGSTTPFDERRFIGLVGMAVKNACSGALTPKEAMDQAQCMFEKWF